MAAIPRPNLPGINQTSFLFGAVVFAFLFFITVRGDLGRWLGLLGLAGVIGGGSPGAPPAPPALPQLPPLGLPGIGPAGVGGGSLG